MPGFEAEIESLRRAGEAARSAGEQAGSVDLAGPLSAISAALPGSRAGFAATGAGRALDEQVEAASRSAADLGGTMGTAAANYEAHENAAIRDLAGWFMKWGP